MTKEIKLGEIEVIERSSLALAELEFLIRKETGCWQVVSPLKMVWSWKVFDYVFRFSMKKVERAYHLHDLIKEANKAVLTGYTEYLKFKKAKQQRDTISHT